MKPLHIFMAVALTLSSAYAHAQASEPLTQRAADITRTLAPQLGLDDARMLRLKRLTLTKLQQEQEVERMYAGDTDMRQTKLQAVAAEYHEQLKTLLTAGQLQRYEQLIATAPIADATAKH